MNSCNYMKTIDDMQNEKYYLSHYNEFEYNHDYEKLTMYYRYS